jgi:uncharacterized protein
MKTILSLSILLFSLLSFSQDKIPYIDYDDIAEEVAKYSGEEKYNKVLQSLAKVNKNDSTYCAILTSKSYYLIMQENYADAVQAADEGLNIDCTSSSTLFLIMNKGVALENMEKYQDAIDLYDKGLERFPANHKLWFNKATCYEKMKNYPKAIEAYQKVITMNPLYRNAHLFLGNLCYRQNLTTQALMCYNMALLVEPDSDRAFSLLRLLNEAMSGKNEYEPDEDLVISEDDEAFEDINLILDNRIALSKKYKIDNDIDIAVVRQTHAMLEQLEDFEGNGGFWDKRYVPLYKWIKENDQFDNFVYTITYSIQNEKFKKIVEKNIDKITEFIGGFIAETYDVMSPQDKMVDGTDKQVHYYYSNQVLQAEGQMEGETSIGDWIFYDENGSLSGKGTYNDKGERTGDWSWYYDNGQLKETAVYSDGELNGKNASWHRNGKPYVQTAFKNGKFDGEYKYYLESGALKQKKYYKEDELEGKYLAYFNVGDVLLPEFDVDYIAGKAQNNALEYYAHGDVYSNIEFKEGKRNGLETQYYWNKQKSMEASYSDDALNGPYIKYYPNGQIQEQGQSVDGMFDGPWKSYYLDGTLESEFEYDNGKLTGLFKAYDTDGKPHYEFEYRRGEIISYEYFDKEGQVLTENRKKGGKFYFKGYYANGNIMSEGKYDISGGKMGEWKYYNINGELTDIGSYEEDLEIGTHKSYFANGELSTIADYDKGSLTGYFQGFHVNGQLQTQGWYKDGLQHGEWRYYNIDGVLNNISFYHKGDVHGIQNYFGASGDKTKDLHYTFGKLNKEVIFNEKGDINQTIDFENAQHKYTLTVNHLNGNKKLVIEYVNGLKHGKYERYNYDGSLYITGGYVNDLMNGEWIWRHDDGTPRYKETYLNGSEDGQSFRYYENGQVEDEMYYDYGLKNGEWLSFYEDGTLEIKTTYVKNNQHGRKEFYSNEGKLQLVRFYKHGTLIGYSYLDTSGNEVEMIPISKETGTIEAFYDNGKPSRVMSYKNGQLDGNYKAYYYSGELENELTYKNGEYHNTDTDYYEDGKVKKKMDYFFGVINGEVVIYYPNGKLKEVINYKNDEKHGEYKYYDESGKLIKTDYYFNDSVYKSKTN